MFCLCVCVYPVLSYLCRSPPPQVPGQLPVGVESYNADYHIGNRMKIRCVHEAHMSKNMAACCVCVCVCVCVCCVLCLRRVYVEACACVSVCVCCVFVCASTCLGCSVVCLCVSLLVWDAVYRFPLPVSTNFKYIDIYAISI